MKRLVDFEDRGIASTEVPVHLRHIVDALVYESNRTDEE